ncbi:hypothetical protein BX666DRAFT_1870507 [Dichotomocladium elegans]|nr:hypothetical protein BX666DRAFT_1870507 [Dichotomocladium elegans]
MALNHVLGEPAFTTGPIPIQSHRRKSTTALFGISPHSTDDFVQKDLISSSWT